MGKGPVSVALAVAAAAVGVALGMGERTAAFDPVVEVVDQVDQTHTFEVHVAGWVNSPGVISVSDGAIVADVIELAGGLRPGALSELINLAAPVRSGDQIVVPGPEAEAAESAAGGLIALNRATAEELESLPGVGPVLAERIVAHRDANGPFSAVEDLLQVPGIGEAKLASIRDLVRVP